MGKENKIDLRMIVGTPDGPRGNVWRCFSSKNEVYISHGKFGNIEKFSFHSSGICRHAFTKEEGPAKGEADRVMQKWRRDAAPESGGIVYALVVRFPTDYLSTALALPKKSTVWIPPAPAENATSLHFVFSRASESLASEIASASGNTIISYATLPNGEAFIVSWQHHDWIGGEDFTFPKLLSPDKEYVVSTEDPDQTGRPARFILYQGPTKEEPVMKVTEYGAYPVPLGTKFDKPMGKFTRDKILKSSRDKKQV